MRHEIIMPALGMAQKTGLIIAWHKAPGDPVKASDILLDVETDKSTVEVEAGHDGFVAELVAAAGADVPVGSTIAVITRDKPAAVASAPAAAAKPEPQTSAPVAATAAAPAPAPAIPTAVAANPAGGSSSARDAASGRILASPKARRLAAERGIDLGRLAASGLDRPIHVADLDRLPPEPRMEAAAAAMSAPALSEIEAEAPLAAVRSLLDLARREGHDAQAARLFAQFAAASLREARGGAGDVTVALGLGEAALYRNPDRVRLSGLAPEEAPAAPDLTLFDLTGTGLRSARLGTGSAFTLVLTDAPGDALRLRFLFEERTMAPSLAIAFVKDFAARIADPLRQLL